jgi:hypothetical protein
MIVDLLKEQLADYMEQFKINQSECIQLMKEGKEWQEHAKKGAGLKLMIECCLFEIKKYSNQLPNQER